MKKGHWVLGFVLIFILAITLASIQLSKKPWEFFKKDFYLAPPAGDYIQGENFYFVFEENGAEVGFHVENFSGNTHFTNLI